MIVVAVRIDDNSEVTFDAAATALFAVVCAFDAAVDALTALS